MRYNASGYVILHIPFETTIHARKEVLAIDAEVKLRERLKGEGTHPPCVGELMEMADTEPVTSLTDVVRSALPSAEVVVEHFEPGDPQDCDCAQCKRAEEVATGQSWEPECDHKPDYASVRSCSSKDLGCEVQCSLCNRWGAFCVDDKSVGWGD